jgi:multicomponent K+:H+ antiporter subunit A
MHPPLIDKFELASAMAFDLGVYLTVIGAVMLALTELGLLGQRGRHEQDAGHEADEDAWGHR